MTRHETSDSEVFDTLAKEFVERFRKGKHPSVSEYASRHPQLEERVVFGTAALDEGENELTFEIVGKHDRSRNHYLGIDALHLSPSDKARATLRSAASSKPSSSAKN